MEIWFVNMLRCAVEAATCNSILCYCKLKEMNVRKNSICLISEIVGLLQLSCLLSTIDLEPKLQLIAAYEGDSQEQVNLNF